MLFKVSAWKRTASAALISVLALGCRGPADVAAPDASPRKVSGGGEASLEEGSGRRVEAFLDVLPRTEGGATVLDLESCLELAFSRNLGLISSRLSDVSTQLALRSARSAFYPSLTASGSHSDGAGSAWRSGSLTLSQNTPWGTAFSASLSETWSEGSRSASVSVGIDQPLFAGFGTAVARNTLSRAEINSLISRADLELEAQGLAFRATSLYYSAARQLETVKVNRRALDRSRKFLERTKIFQEVGRKTVLDVSNSQIQLAEREISLAQAERGFDDALDALKLALDIEPDTDITVKAIDMHIEEIDDDDRSESLEIQRPDREAGVAGSVRLKCIDKKAAGGPAETIKVVFEPKPLDHEALLLEALSSRLDVMNARRRMSLSRLSFELSRNLARPDLDLSLDYSASNTDAHFDDALVFGGDDDQWVVGFSLTYPWGKVADKVDFAQSQIAVRQAEINLREAELGVKIGIREQLRLLRTTEQNIFAFAMKIKGANKALEAAKILVDHGKADNFFIVEAEDDLLSAQTGFIGVLINYRTQLAQLDLRLGRKTDKVDLRLLGLGSRPRQGDDEEEPRSPGEETGE